MSIPMSILNLCGPIRPQSGLALILYHIVNSHITQLLIRDVGEFSFLSQTSMLVELEWAILIVNIK